MNMNSKKIAIWLTVAMLIAFAVAASITTSPEFKNINLNFASNGTQNKNIVLVDQTTTSDDNGVRSIDISMVSEDTSIILSDSNKIKAHLTGKENSNIKLTLIEERVGNEIRIYIKRTPEFIIPGSFSTDMKIEITLPKSYASDLKIKSISGEITIPEIKVGNLTFDTVSGNINSEASSNDVTFTTISGETTLKNLTGSLRSNTVSGDINATFSSLGSSRINTETISGSARLILPSASDFNINFKTVSGELKNSFGSSTSSGNSIDFNSVSGDLNIEK